jgi:hypothetical protein
MRIVLVLLFSLTANVAEATSYRRPDRPATPAEEIELARYDEALRASQRRLKARIAADTEVQEMLDFVFPDKDTERENTSAITAARLSLAQRDELAGLIWVLQERDQIVAEQRELDAASAARARQLQLLIAQWKTSGSVVWQVLDALEHADPAEQKRLLTMALKKPLHSSVSKRARQLTLRYFEMMIAESDPELRKDLQVYRPDSLWIMRTVLATGSIDFEGLLLSMMLEPFCDLQNPSDASLSAEVCYSVLMQTQLVHLMTPSELPAEQFKEPELSAFLADQELFAQVLEAANQCADKSHRTGDTTDKTPFVINILRATSTADWRSYLRKVLRDLKQSRRSGDRGEQCW